MGVSSRPFTIDLHVHTVTGSADSNLEPLAAIARAAEIGLSALCITEHDNMWDVDELRRQARAQGVLLLAGIEVTTEVGHVGLFGVERYVTGFHRLAELRRFADEHGALLIANHPFRYRLDPRLTFMNGGQDAIDPDRPERAAELELLRAVDAIEALNGACGEEENRFALEVAAHLGLPVVAGSDSHSASSVGCVATVLEEPVADERELIEMIRAKRCRPARIGPDRQPIFFQ